MPNVNDRRTDKSTPWAYVVFTDKFMSGWGDAPGRSLYALAVSDPNEEAIVLANGRARSEMKRPRTVVRFRADGTPAVKMHEGDHLSVTDKADASRWYVRGGFV